ncbi:MAG: 4a-hydroxytetrahydrobiopterin dehydratase [Candidatus Nanopelagicales bacterium]|jgi:4a-hydroxytetrahydrobiopterin dehydratase
MPEPLDEAALTDLANSLPHWQVADGQLLRDVEAPTFPAAIEWVVMIAQAAEAMDHHPDIDIRWRRLHLALSTHSAGGRITELDVALAERIDAIVD